MVTLSCDLSSKLSIVWSTAKLVHRDGELKTTERIVHNGWEQIFVKYQINWLVSNRNMK